MTDPAPRLDELLWCARALNHAENTFRRRGLTGDADMAHVMYVFTCTVASLVQNPQGIDDVADTLLADTRADIIRLGSFIDMAPFYEAEARR